MSRRGIEVREQGRYTQPVGQPGTLHVRVRTDTRELAVRFKTLRTARDAAHHLREHPTIAYAYATRGWA